MELKSHLGKWISEFLAFRAARGLSTKSHLANLAKLDSCCRRCNADANGLSKDAVSGWLCEMAGQCTKSRLYSMKISVLCMMTVPMVRTSLIIICRNGTLC